MATLVFDIETSALPLENFDEAQQEYLFRDAQKLTEILDANGIEYKVTNIQEDAAAQYAVKRDSDNKRLPVVFIAGECLGGREELVNAASSGELKKKVFGA